jgi:hypothetical protein
MVDPRFPCLSKKLFDRFGFLLLFAGTFSIPGFVDLKMKSEEEKWILRFSPPFLISQQSHKTLYSRKLRLFKIN